MKTHSHIQLTILIAAFVALTFHFENRAAAQGDFRSSNNDTPRVAQKTIGVNTQLNSNIELPKNGYEIPAQTPESSELSSATQPTSTSNPDKQIVASKRLTEVLMNGGPLMIPIALCSFVLVVFVFERLVSLRRRRIIPQPFSKMIVEQISEGEIDRNEAIEACEDNKSPMAQVYLAGLAKWGKTSVEVEQAILDEGERQSNHLRRFLRLINGIATVCPLLGLLGTVLGMIHAFDAIATVDSSVDPRVMIATGISQALLTTAAGMTVAIPALIAYMYFSSRVDRSVMEMDANGMRLVRQICAEGQSSRASKSRSKKAA